MVAAKEKKRHVKPINKFKRDFFEPKYKNLSNEDSMFANDATRRATKLKESESRASKGNATVSESRCDFHGKGSNETELEMSVNDQFKWMENMTECPVFRPSKEEFEDPLAYVMKIAPEASKYGICKVLAPLITSTPAGIVLMNEKKAFKFMTKVQPLRLAEWKNGNTGTFFMRGRNYSIRGFEKMANKATARRYRIAGCLSPAYLEKEFWTEMLERKKGTVEYGINVDGSAFSTSPDDPLSSSLWNLQTLPLHPKSVLRLLETPIPGVSEPMLYIGMLFSMFAWHVEDHYLYSINYHHCGAPKTWYGVPGYSALQFEDVVRQNVYNLAVLPMDGEDSAFDMLLEKTTMFSPAVLLQHGVPVYKTVQMPGEFVITFPQAYHAGFSHGFNCGEAVNFATEDWFSFGAAATKRYALLRRMPIIPYEEILCREAILLVSKSSSYNPKSSLKESFACLLRAHHFILWCLKKYGKLTFVSPKVQESIFCSLCKRECYIAHIVCKCQNDPICIFHEKEIFNCQCGKTWRLHLREDILEMELVAKMFEQDERVREKVELQLKNDSIFYGWQSLSLVVNTEYIPYSEIELLKYRNTKEGSSIRANRNAQKNATKRDILCTSKEERRSTSSGKAKVSEQQNKVPFHHHSVKIKAILN